jgi:hypothetical protein
MGRSVTPEIEAHWRYQLEYLTSWKYHSGNILNGGLSPAPAEVRWLCEEARYQCHLADAHRRRLEPSITKTTPESCDG